MSMKVLRRLIWDIKINIKIYHLLKLILALIAPNYLKKQWANKPFEDSSNSSENKRMNEFLCKLVAAQIATERLPKNITEIGCLNGIRLAELSNYLRDDEVIYTGFDINEEAIVFGKKQYGHLTNLKMEVGDLFDFIDERKFDLVFNWAVLMYVHPFKIKDVLEKIILNSSTALIIEPSENRYLYNKLIRRNYSYTHNYGRLITQIIGNRTDFLYQTFNMSHEVWKPKYGMPKVHIIKKIDTI